MSELTLKDYQARAAATALYPRESAVEYTALGLVGEAGEIANKVKKVLRGDYDKDQLREMLVGEIGDVLWYAAMLARELDLDLGEIGRANLDKLASRKERGVLTGSGDDR
jgi:NTP pyrophosphatase (non-canonical NTP hydrolase)